MEISDLFKTREFSVESKTLPHYRELAEKAYPSKSPDEALALFIDNQMWKGKELLAALSTNAQQAQMLARLKLKAEE